jgi:hypothetical protein
MHRAHEMHVRDPIDAETNGDLGTMVTKEKDRADCVFWGGVNSLVWFGRVGGCTAPRWANRSTQRFLTFFPRTNERTREVDRSDWTVWDLEQYLYLVAIRY